MCLCVHTDSGVTLMFSPLWQHLYPQLRREADALLRASESTKDLLDKFAATLLTLEKMNKVSS